MRLWPRQLLTQPHAVEELPCGAELRGHEGPVCCCSFSPDGGILATAGRDRVSYRRMHPHGPTAPSDPRFLNGLFPTASLNFSIRQISRWLYLHALYYFLFSLKLLLSLFFKTSCLKSRVVAPTLLPVLRRTDR